VKKTIDGYQLIPLPVSPFASTHDSASETLGLSSSSSLDLNGVELFHVHQHEYLQIIRSELSRNCAEGLDGRTF
jgi:hypothetical protein